MNQIQDLCIFIIQAKIEFYHLIVGIKSSHIDHQLFFHFLRNIHIK